MISLQKYWFIVLISLQKSFSTYSVCHKCNLFFINNTIWPPWRNVNYIYQRSWIRLKSNNNEIDTHTSTKTTSTNAQIIVQTSMVNIYYYSSLRLSQISKKSAGRRLLLPSLHGEVYVVYESKWYARYV